MMHYAEEVDNWLYDTNNDDAATRQIYILRMVQYGMYSNGSKDRYNKMHFVVL